MPITKEYRFPMPMTVDDYHIGQLYAVMHASERETAAAGAQTDTAVEIIENRPFVNEQGMASGQYTYKVYHIANRLPRILRALGPASVGKVEERAWSAYPHIKMVITNPFLGNRLEIHVESMHLTDTGTTENAFNLTPEELERRTVVHVDIGRDRVQNEHTKDADMYDPASYRSEKASVGPLVGNWIHEAKPVMCAYKLITVKCAIFGLQGRLEKLLDGVEQGLYLRFHKQVFTLMDEWYGMTMEMIREAEDRLKERLDHAISKLDLQTRDATSNTAVQTTAQVEKASADATADLDAGTPTLEQNSS